MPDSSVWSFSRSSRQRPAAFWVSRALVRWDSPEHGPVSPAEFVPLAEETELILDLGDWITRQAFRDCRRWAGRYVSVNLSARQFQRQNVAERVLRYAEEANLRPPLSKSS